MQVYPRIVGLSLFRSLYRDVVSFKSSKTWLFDDDSVADDDDDGNLFQLAYLFYCFIEYLFSAPSRKWV